MRMTEGTRIMLPVKLMEYVAMGIPCVAPKTDAIARYFDDSMIRFFTPGDPHSLAEAILDLHDHEDKRRSLAENAYQRFACVHTWAEQKRMYQALVSGLLRGPRASADAGPGA